MRIIYLFPQFYWPLHYILPLVNSSIFFLDLILQFNQEMRKVDKHQSNLYIDRNISFYRNSNELRSSENRQRQKIHVKNLNQQYFPINQNIDQGDSVSSNNTTKMKGNLSSRSNSFQPKFSIKSPSESQKSTKKQLYNSISKLTTQLENKNKALIKKNSSQKIKESEVLDLYRIINFYEGKIQQLQKQTKRYEEALEKIGRQCDQKTKNKARTEQLFKVFEQMKKQNSQLAGKVEEKDYWIGVLQDKTHKQQIKIKFFQSKQSYLKKSNSSQGNEFKNKTSSILSRNLSISLKQKKQNYGNIQSKINRIESTLNYLKKQNQALQNELQQKQNKIHQYQIQLSKFYNDNKPMINQLEKQCIKPKKDSLIVENILKNEDLQNNIKEVSSKLLIKPIQTEPILTKTPIEQPSQISQISQKTEPIKINQQIFRKLKYQLLTQQITHQQLLKLLSNQQLQCQILQEYPYNLSTQQAQQLLEWIQILNTKCFQQQKNLYEYLKKLVPIFSNLTIRKQNQLKIQICNQFQNRQQEFKQKIQKSNKMNMKEIQKYFSNWGLSQSHIDVVLKYHYEETGNLKNVDLKVVKSVIDRWAHK